MAIFPYVHDSSVVLDKLAPPYFHISAGITSPPGAFSSFSPLIALTSFAFPYLIYCTEVWGNSTTIHLNPIIILQKNVFELLLCLKF